MKIDYFLNFEKLLCCEYIQLSCLNRHVEIKKLSIKRSDDINNLFWFKWCKTFTVKPRRLFASYLTHWYIFHWILCFSTSFTHLLRHQMTPVRTSVSTIAPTVNADPPVVAATQASLRFVHLNFLFTFFAVFLNS